MTIEVGNRTGSYKIWGVTFFTRHELSSSTNYHFNCVRKCQDCLGFLAVRQIPNRTNHSIIPKILLKKWRIPYIYEKKCRLPFKCSSKAHFSTVEPSFMLAKLTCWLAKSSQGDEVDMAEVAEEVRFICGCILADAMFMSIGILPIL